MQTLIVKINKTDASLSVDRQLVLGSHYQVQFVGLGDGEIGTLILSSCRKGKTIAATNEDGMLAINTQEAIDVFERKPNCPYAVTIHAYVTVESATIAESTLSLLWSPMQFDVNGSPVQFVGPAGPKGEPGPSLYDTWLDMNPEGTWEEFVNEFRGKDGKDGLTLTRDGLYAFTVEGENLYISANNESVIFGNDEFGNIDRTKPKWKIIDGNLYYIFYKDGKEYTKVNLGSVRGPAGPQGAKGEKGDVGLTEEEKQAISNSINTLDSHITNVANSLDSHQTAENPHGINPGLIGAVSEGTFDSTIKATREEVFQRISSGDENVLEQALEQIKEQVSKVLRYKGSVPTYDDLPYENIEAGDVYNVEDTGMNYAWNDSKWDALGGIIEVTADMVKINLPSYNKLSDWVSAVDYFLGQLPSSDSIKKAMSDSDNHIRNKSNPHNTTAENVGAYTKEEVDNKLNNISIEETDPVFTEWKNGRNIAIGEDAVVGAEVFGAVQIGIGTNNKSQTLQFHDYAIVNEYGKLDPRLIRYSTNKIKDIEDLENGVWTISTDNEYSLPVFSVPISIAVENSRFNYSGEFIIEVTEGVDMTLTFEENPYLTVVWVGDVPDLSIIGKHHFAYKTVSYKGFNATLYLNEYFVEESTTTESEA